MVGSSADDASLVSGVQMTVDALQVSGNGNASDQRLALGGHLTVNGSGSASFFRGEVLSIAGGELTVNGSGTYAFSLLKGLVGSEGGTLSGSGQLAVEDTLTLQNATVQSSLHLLQVRNTGADLYLNASTLSLTGTAQLDVDANAGNDAMDGTLWVNGASSLHIGAGAAVTVTGKLILGSNATLSIDGTGQFDFAPPSESGQADFILGHHSTLDVTQYNADNNGAPLVITDALIRPGTALGESATIRGDVVFGENTTLQFRVGYDGSLNANTLTTDGGVTALLGADLKIQMDSSLPAAGHLTLIDGNGVLLPQWSDIHYSGVDATQMFRPYLSGSDLKVEIITSGITTGSLLSDDGNANYVYAATGADSFLVHGADVIFGNDGDDFFQVLDHDAATGRPAFSFLDGGSGTNELLIDGHATSYNLDLYAPWIQNFDVISLLNDNNSDSAFISADAVRSILGDKTTSDLAGVGNALIIKGETGDHLSLVSATGTGWAADSNVPEIAGYTGYTSTNTAGDEVHLYIQNNISVHQTVAA